LIDLTSLSPISDAFAPAARGNAECTPSVLPVLTTRRTVEPVDTAQLTWPASLTWPPRGPLLRRYSCRSSPTRHDDFAAFVLAADGVACWPASRGSRQNLGDRLECRVRDEYSMSACDSRLARIVRSRGCSADSPPVPVAEPSAGVTQSYARCCARCVSASIERANSVTACSVRTKTRAGFSPLLGPTTTADETSFRPTLPSASS
jgi:hypothetical protein